MCFIFFGIFYARFFYVAQQCFKRVPKGANAVWKFDPKESENSFVEQFLTSEAKAEQEFKAAKKRAEDFSAAATSEDEFVVGHFTGRVLPPDTPVEN